MGTLYLSGAQCVHAEFNKEEHWKNFDEQQAALRELAQQFELSVDRDTLADQGDPCFIVKHKNQNFGGFYAGEAFEADLSIETSDTFPSRASAFIEALNKHEAFSDFHNLQWCTPRVLYFVSS